MDRAAFLRSLPFFHPATPWESRDDGRRGGRGSDELSTVLFRKHVVSIEPVAVAPQTSAPSQVENAASVGVGVGPAFFKVGTAATTVASKPTAPSNDDPAMCPFEAVLVPMASGGAGESHAEVMAGAEAISSPGLSSVSTSLSLSQSPSGEKKTPPRGRPAGMASSSSGNPAHPHHLFFRFDGRYVVCVDHTQIIGLQVETGTPSYPGTACGKTADNGKDRSDKASEGSENNAAEVDATDRCRGRRSLNATVHDGGGVPPSLTVAFDSCNFRIFCLSPPSSPSSADPAAVGGGSSSTADPSVEVLKAISAEETEGDGRYLQDVLARLRACLPLDGVPFNVAAALLSSPFIDTSSNGNPPGHGSSSSPSGGTLRQTESSSHEPGQREEEVDDAAMQESEPMDDDCEEKRGTEKGVGETPAANTQTKDGIGCISVVNGIKDAAGVVSSDRGGDRSSNGDGSPPPHKSSIEDDSKPTDNHGNNYNRDSIKAASHLISHERGAEGRTPGTKRKRVSYAKSWEAVRSIHELASRPRDWVGPTCEERVEDLLMACAEGLAGSYRRESDLAREADDQDERIALIQADLDDALTRIFPPPRVPSGRMQCRGGGGAVGGISARDRGGTTHSPLSSPSPQPSTHTSSHGDIENLQRKAKDLLQQSRLTVADRHSLVLLPRR